MAAGNSLLQRGPVTHDPNGSVVNLYPLHHRPDVGLPEGDWPRGNIFAHKAAEALNCPGIDGMGPWARLNALQGIFRPVALDLEGRDTVLQDVIHLGQAVLHHRVEALQLVFSGSLF
ncbi:hypothetical protein [Bradyrhizobium manausense]|uniref:hypothetical protein n=1 Tax=Bradyrhizobium manausense TaxID=989370 RepID=UPI0020122BC7|nr:hypothetical protein [Bradyrhizobium manausense]